MVRPALGAMGGLGRRFATRSAKRRREDRCPPHARVGRRQCPLCRRVLLSLYPVVFNSSVWRCPNAVRHLQELAETEYLPLTGGQGRFFPSPRSFVEADRSADVRHGSGSASGAQAGAGRYGGGAAESGGARLASADAAQGRGRDTRSPTLNGSSVAAGQSAGMIARASALCALATLRSITAPSPFPPRSVGSRRPNPAGSGRRRRPPACR